MSSNNIKRLRLHFTKTLHGFFWSQNILEVVPNLFCKPEPCLQSGYYKFTRPSGNVLVVFIFYLHYRLGLLFARVFNVPLSSGEFCALGIQSVCRYISIGGPHIQCRASRI